MQQAADLPEMGGEEAAEQAAKEAAAALDGLKFKIPPGTDFHVNNINGRLYLNDKNSKFGGVRFSCLKIWVAALLACLKPVLLFFLPVAFQPQVKSILTLEISLNLVWQGSLLRSSLSPLGG